MSDIKNYIQNTRKQEVETTIEKLVAELKKQGLSVEFGKIGVRTTYAMIYNESHETEIVGYTFIKDVKYYKETTGKLKALQQAIARKETSEAIK